MTGHAGNPRQQQANVASQLKSLLVRENSGTDIEMKFTETICENRRGQSRPVAIDARHDQVSITDLIDDARIQERRTDRVYFDVIRSNSAQGGATVNYLELPDIIGTGAWRGIEPARLVEIVVDQRKTPHSKHGQGHRCR